MEPAVKPAAAATRSGVVGVLATTGTLQSAKFAALLDRFATDVRVITQPCPGLVELIESGDLHSPHCVNCWPVTSSRCLPKVRHHHPGLHPLPFSNRCSSR
jgi:glutamate racemase